jgi:hypothetical protein
MDLAIVIPAAARGDLIAGLGQRVIGNVAAASQIVTTGALFIALRPSPGRSSCRS